MAAGDSRGERDQGGQARALMLQAECSELRAKVEKRNREVRELNQMLKAWEAMRHSKDQQIAQLVERCRKFEEEAADKARAIDAMRSRLGRDGQPGGASVGAGSVGSVSFAIACACALARAVVVGAFGTRRPCENCFAPSPALGGPRSSVSPRCSRGWAAAWARARGVAARSALRTIGRWRRGRRRLRRVRDTMVTYLFQSAEGIFCFRPARRVMTLLAGLKTLFTSMKPQSVRDLFLVVVVDDVMTRRWAAR